MSSEPDDVRPGRFLNGTFVVGVLVGVLLAVLVYFGAGALLGADEPVSEPVATEDAADSSSGLAAGAPVAPQGPITYCMYPEQTNRMTLNGWSFSRPDPLVGEVIVTAYDYPISNYFICDGRVVSAEKDRALWSIVSPSDPDNLHLPKYSWTDDSGKVLTHRIANIGAYPQREDLDEPAATVGGLKYYPVPDLPDARETRYIGSIYLIGGLPADGERGFVPCDGRMISKRDNEALFSLIGTKFGGDGQKEFAVPDLSDVEPPVAGARFYISTNGYYWPPS